MSRGLDTALDQYADRIESEPNSGCWIWVGARDRLGYAKVTHKSGTGLVHKRLYEASRGEVPAGLVLDHKCRLTSCVNPGHVEPVTQRENVMRGVSFMAERARKTHCARGHEISGDNVYRGVTGRRTCRACRREYMKGYLRDYYQKNKAKWKRVKTC